MKLNSPIAFVATMVAALTLFTGSAQARQSGTLPEDNGSTPVMDDHGGLNNNTNSTSNSGSGKNKGNGKKNIEVKIKLVSAPEFATAKGSARFRDRSNKQDIQVEVQVSKQLVGTVLGVTVGDTVISTVTINALGKGKLELSTEHGDIVPAVVAGTLVGVVTETGAIVLAGTF